MTPAEIADEISWARDDFRRLVDNATTAELRKRSNGTKWTRIRAAITSLGEESWTPIEYTNALFDEDTGVWVSRAEVTEIGFTAFAAQPNADHVHGRLVVRLIPDLNAEAHRAVGQDTLFDTWRFHAFFTTADPDLLDTIAADKTHRGHAVIEQVHADLKGSALAHLPSGVFTANAAWLVLAVIAFNLTRVAGVLTGTPSWPARPQRPCAAN